jgi:MFS family permease
VPPACGCHKEHGFYLVAVRGFSMAAAGGVLAVYVLGSMVCQITGGWLTDALGRRPSLTMEMLANGASLITSSPWTSTSPTPWMTAAHHGDLLVTTTGCCGEGSKVVLVPAAGSGEPSYRPGGRWAG